MKRFYPIALLLLLTSTSFGQKAFKLDDLMDFTGYSVSRFDGLVAKKDYRRDYESPRESRSNYNYIQEVRKKGVPEPIVTRKLAFEEKAGAPVIAYQTTSLAEFEDIRKDLARSGFHSYAPESDPQTPLLYQHENTVVRTSLEIRDSVPYYSVRIEKEVLPRVREIEYAEDLLALRSHEYLVTTFGAANVTRDVFRYTQADTNMCSVLFPNTPREVIFIWDDELNYRDVSFLIIGGNTLTNGTARNASMITTNEWQSKQGVFAGMKLEQLQELNGGKVSFHGFNTEQPGMLTQSTGKLDFNKLGLVLSCLNCINNESMERQQVVDSDMAMREERKVYVSSIIIIPEKQKKQITAAR